MVGGVFEKIFGARQAGVKTVYVPRENAKDVPFDLYNITVVPVDTIQEIMAATLQEAE
jgi:ATP-dependent Lon protease